MARHPAAGTALLPLCLLLLFLLNGCASIPYDYPRPVSSALYRPEGTSLGKKVQARAINHPGASGFYLLPTGLDAFTARAILIDQAEKTLDLQYYIFHDDLMGRFVYDRLLAAADRGVRVRLLLDDWHQTPETDWLLATMAIHPNLEVRLFNPFGTHRRTFLARALRMAFGPDRLRGRLHNKAFIADNSVAIVGGRNIGAEYFGASDEFNFYDVDIMAVGPIAREASANFDDYWNCVLAMPVSALVRRRPSADDLKSLRRDLETQRECLKKSTYWLKVQNNDLLKRIAAGQVPLIGGPADFLADHPLKCIDPDDARQAAKMTQQLKEILESARSELLIVTPYFVPRQGGMRLFQKLRGRNLTIKVITNSFLSSDAPLAQIGYMRYRKDLLRMGVELYEIKPTLVQIHHDQDRRQFAGDFRRLCYSFIQSGGALVQRGASRIQIGGSSLQFGSESRGSLHAKTFVLDRQTVFVGSFNFDPRSIKLDTQNGVVIHSPELANQAAYLFDEGISPARTYRVTLLGDDDLVWITEDNGREVRYYQEPLSRFWPRLSLKSLSWLTPELLL
ncbi:MAG: phospholipase D family protein [Deltaproteobacteria bacterium]|nr:phospholipase D family protein [Deltaproteobacteria bacterium]